MKLFKDNIPKIESILGYSFRDKSLLTQAFTRTSFCNEHRGSGVKYQSNEVLEFFGDSVLSVAIVSILADRCTERYEHGISTKLTEGDFSNIKSNLSDKTNLSKTTLSLGLEKFLIMGEGDLKLGIEKEPSVMEDLFESIIGAVYIDCGMDIRPVKKLVERILDITAYTSKEPPIQSTKNALQEFCQDKAHRLPSPVYKTISESGPDHEKVYERGVYIGDRLLARATGKNQKTADALCAKLGLEILLEEERAASAKTPVKMPAKAQGEKKQTDGKTKKAKQAKAPEPKKAPESKKAPEPKKAPESKKAPEQKKRLKAKPAIQTQVQAPIASPGKAPLPASVALKKIAISKRIASPTFRDLGEAKGKGGRAEYRVECHFHGKTVEATAATRLGAREASAKKMLDALSKTK